MWFAQLKVSSRPYPNASLGHIYQPFNGPERIEEQKRLAAIRSDTLYSPPTAESPDVLASPDTDVALDAGQRLDTYREPMFVPMVDIPVSAMELPPTGTSSSDSALTMESTIRDSTLPLPSINITSNGDPQDDQQYQDMGTTSTLSIHRLDMLTRRHNKYFQKTTASIDKVNTRLTKEMNRLYRNVNEIRESANINHRNLSSAITQLNQQLSARQAEVHEFTMRIREFGIVLRGFEERVETETSRRKQQNDNVRQQIDDLRALTKSLETKVTEQEAQLQAQKHELRRMTNDVMDRISSQAQSKEAFEGSS